MEINILIKKVKKKICDKIKCEKIIIEDKTFLHKKHKNFINEFFKMYSNWGSQFIYAGTGFCQYTRLKKSTDTANPEGQWGLHMEAGYGVHLGRTFLITAGFTKGLFISSTDEDQDYPFLFNIGFGFRF